MSKFLNETGLSHFWTKVKDYLKQKFVAIGDAIEFNEDEKKITLSDIGLRTRNVYIGENKIAVDTEHGNGYFSVDADNNQMTVSAQLGYDTHNHISFSASPSIDLVLVDGTEDHSSTTIEAGAISLGSSGGNNDFFNVSIGQEDGIYIEKYSQEDNDNYRTTFGFKGFETRNNDTNARSEMTPEQVKSPKIIKDGGTATQVLLANGDVSELNAAGGIPKLNAQGKLDASLVDIDNTLFEVVAALPTTGIKKNRIYLVPSEKKEDNNTYIEYIYTGDVTAAYDKAKWEKLGEYTADIDLTPYASKDNIMDGFNFIGLSNKVVLDINMDDEHTNELEIPLATTTQAGVMSAADKRFIDIFSARYPLKISSFTATPSLLEVGASSDINFAWGYENNDLHTPLAIQIKTLEGDNVTVNRSATSYKESGVDGATTAATKTATLTVASGDKTVTRSVNLTYHYPSYIGVVADGATIDEAAVKALTKSVEWGKGKTAALTQANQKIVYAYPASYGDLTSIKDGNGFQGFAGYTKQTVTVNGQAYNVYVQNLPATSSSTYTFA